VTVTEEELRTKLLAVLAVSVGVSVGLFFLSWFLFDAQQRTFERDLSRVVQRCLFDAAQPLRVQLECNRRFPGRLQQAREDFNASRRLADLQQWAKSRGWEPPAGIGPDP
jgi:uncharacterized membrane protein YccC